MLKFPNFFEKVIQGFANIFNESPAWAEFMSCFSAYLYCFLAVGSVVFIGKPPEAWPSQDLITDIIDGRIWIIIAFAVGSFQLGSLITMRRGLRILSAFVMLIWQFIIVVMAWPVIPWSPVLAFPAMMAFTNFFAIARHARDWRLP